MNPLDATIVRLGVYIGQLEAQVQEIHRQLVEKTKELDEAKSEGTKPWQGGDDHVIARHVFSDHERVKAQGLIDAASPEKEATDEQPH